MGQHASAVRSVDSEPTGAAKSEVLVKKAARERIHLREAATPRWSRASVQPVDMSFEEAMRFTLTAGLSVPAAKGV